MLRWILIAALLAGPAGRAVAAPVLRWTPADTTITAGQQATLAVVLDDTLSVRTLELIITYPDTIIGNGGGAPGALFDGFNLFAGFEEVTPSTPGQWHAWCVILGAADWTVGPGELYRWTLTGDVVGKADLVTVTVNLLPPGGGQYAATLPMTTVTVGEAVAFVPVAALSDEPVLRLFPNPFNPRTRVAIAGGGAAPGWLEIFDVRGRRVARLAADPVAASAADWDGRDDAGRSLPSGVYRFVLMGSEGGRAAVLGTLVR